MEIVVCDKGVIFIFSLTCFLFFIDELNPFAPEIKWPRYDAPLPEITCLACWYPGKRNDNVCKTLVFQNPEKPLNFSRVTWHENIRKTLRKRSPDAMALKGFGNLYDNVFVTISNSFNNKTRQNVSTTKTCGILGCYKMKTIFILNLYNVVCIINIICMRTALY